MKKIYFNRDNVFLHHLKFSNSNKKSITKLVISVIQDEYKRVKLIIIWNYLRYNLFYWKNEQSKL